jgi:hypothetical protein
LYDWIRASRTRKEQKRKAEITAKAQELLDTVEDDDDDEGETAMDRLLLRVQQPSGSTATAPKDIDWRGECVSNILRDWQKKFRDKLPEQKEDVTAKFEAETKEKIDGIKDEQELKLRMPKKRLLSGISQRSLMRRPSRVSLPAARPSVKEVSEKSWRMLLMYFVRLRINDAKSLSEFDSNLNDIVKGSATLTMSNMVLL